MSSLTYPKTNYYYGASDVKEGFEVIAGALAELKGFHFFNGLENRMKNMSRDHRRGDGKGNEQIRKG